MVKRQARTRKRKFTTTRKCQNRYLATKQVQHGGSLWSALGKVGNGLRRIGRTFKSVEGKFKYNTVFHGLPINNKSSEKNNDSPFKVYYVRTLPKNTALLSSIKLSVNDLPAIEKLSEHTNTTSTQSPKYQNLPVLKKYYDAGYLGYLYKGLNNQGQSTLYMLYNGQDTVANNQHELDIDIHPELLMNVYKKLRILVVINDKASSQSSTGNQPNVPSAIPDKNIISLTNRLVACLNGKQDSNERVGQALYNKRLTMNIIDSAKINLSSLPFISHTDIMQIKSAKGISELGQGSGINYPALILSNIHGCNSQIYNNDNGTNQLSNQNSERITELNMQLGILYSNNKEQKTILYSQNNELREMPLQQFTEMATTEKPIKYVLVSKL